MAFFSKISLSNTSGGTGALVSYLARSADNVGKTHHLIWALFPNLEGKRPFLYRMTGSSVREPILIYSADEPKDTHGIWSIETPRSIPSFAAGDQVRFNVRVNATVKRRVNGKSRRCDIVMDARYAGDKRDWDEIASSVVPPWAAGQFEKMGFQVTPEAMTVDNYTRHRFAHEGGDTVTLRTVDIAGIGTITDAEAFSSGLLTGIGGGRSYGCGLMLVRKVA